LNNTILFRLIPNLIFKQLLPLPRKWFFQKGNPVENRSCARSCNLCIFRQNVTVSPKARREGAGKRVSQKTCHDQKNAFGNKSDGEIPEVLFPHVNKYKGE